MHSAADQACQIYAAKIREASQRLIAAAEYLSAWRTAGTLVSLDSATLQLRKSLEAVAFASIAPNREAYAEFRRRAEDQKDYTKDYHASKIFRVLSKINPDFFPIPLTGPTAMPDGTLFFGRKHDGYLSKKRFESVYDRLGRHLHTYNPWGTTANQDDLASTLEAVIEESRALLELHATFIWFPQFSGAWVVKVPRDGSPAEIILGATQGEFTVADG